MEIDELVRAIKKKQISLGNFQFEVNNICRGIKRETKVFEKGARLYRGRLLNSKPFAISEMSYPPAHKTGLGRLNNRGCPIFYASTELPTIFLECRAEVNTHIYASEWECLESPVVQVIGFLETNPLEEFLNEIFTMPSDKMNEYTARISTHLLNDKSINGLLYPSIVSMNKFHNVAVKAKYVDKFLRLVNVKLFRIVAITDEYVYQTEEIDVALPDNNGQFKWQNKRKEGKVKSKCC